VVLVATSKLKWQCWYFRYRKLKKKQKVNMMFTPNFMKTSPVVKHYNGRAKHRHGTINLFIPINRETMLRVQYFQMQRRASKSISNHWMLCCSHQHSCFAFNLSPIRIPACCVWIFSRYLRRLWTSTASYWDSFTFTFTSGRMSTDSILPTAPFTALLLFLILHYVISGVTRQALCYKPEGRGFDSRWGRWIFHLA
jgi:hypothetical protein